MWELDIKKAERRRTETFELWCCKRLLRVPWTARRSSQSILKEISPKFSLEGLMLKLKLQYFGHMMQRKDSDAGKDWRQEEKGTKEDEMVGWHHQLHRHEFEQAPGVGDGQGSWCAAVHGVAKSQTQMNAWTELECRMSTHSILSALSWPVNLIFFCLFVFI